MRLGYFVNGYPMPSQTFIRREITAIEATGHFERVFRYCVRAHAFELPDPKDQEEARKTARLLDGGPVPLALAVLVVLLTNPMRWFAAFNLMLTLSRRNAQRGFVKHLAYFVEACLLRRWTARDQVDHLHVHFGTNSTAVAMLCRVLGGPSYSFTTHGPEEFDDPKGLALDLKMHHAAFTVAITEFCVSQLRRWAQPEDMDRIHIIHCGLDQAFLEGEAVPLPTDKRFINIGRLVEQKGQHILLEAVNALVKEGHTDLVVEIIGDGEFRERLETYCREQGITDNVVFAGWRSNADVIASLRASRGLVLPSYAEGLPVVIMEALAMHRPVITTYIAGVPELVTPGETGWLVPAGSLDALLEAMRAMLATPDEALAAMGSRGHARVAAAHNADVEGARLAQLVLAYAKSGAQGVA